MKNRNVKLILGSNITDVHFFQRFFLWCFLLIFSLLGCTGDQAPDNQQKKTESYPWKLICLGQGITAGVGLEGQAAYPAILEDELMQDAFPEVTVVNAGIKGETIAGLNERIEWILQQRFSAILIAMGEKDLMLEKKMFWDQSIQKIRLSNPEALILVGIVTGENSFSKVQSFFKPLDEQYDIEVLDLQLKKKGDNNDFWQENGQDLTSEGQHQLAKKLSLLLLDFGQGTVGRE